MTRARAVVAVSVSMSVLALGACSGEDPEPRLAPPSSSAPTSPRTTAASETVTPTAPAEAGVIDRRGAEAFVAFWFEALSHAMVSGDTSAVDGASARTCRSCAALSKQIEDLYAKGGRVETAGWTVEASTVDGRFNVEEPSFLLRVREAKRSLYDGNDVVDRTPMKKVPMHIELSSSSGGWAVTTLEILG